MPREGVTLLAVPIASLLRCTWAADRPIVGNAYFRHTVTSDVGVPALCE